MSMALRDQKKDSEIYVDVGWGERLTVGEINEIWSTSTPKTSKQSLREEQEQARMKKEDGKEQDNVVLLFWE